MNQNKLPADPLALILGVIALIFGIVGCCCYGITAFVPLVLAIIGLITANKSLREYANHPEAFSPQSRSNVNTAKIINIIAIVINSIIFIMALAVLAFYGSILSAGVLEGIRESQRTSNEDYYNYEQETDSSEVWEDDDYIIDEATDSIENETKEEKSDNDVMKDFDSKY